MANVSEWKRANPEKAKEHARRCYLKTREVRRAAARAYYQANKDRINEASRQWALANSDKVLAAKARRLRDTPAKVRGAIAAWKRRNPARVRALNAKRELAVEQRIPPWANLGAIRQIYEGCPPGYHVDHAIPLHGRTVSGLHVEGNLQYLLALDNLKKGNRHV